MASQCEALGLGTRKKLSSWLVQDPKVEFLSFSNDAQPSRQAVDAKARNSLTLCFAIFVSQPYFIANLLTLIVGLFMVRTEAKPTDRKMVCRRSHGKR